MNSGREKKHSVFKQTIIIVLSCFLVTLTTLYNYMGEILFLFCNYLCELPSPQIREWYCTDEASGKEKAEVSCEVGYKPGAKAAILY